MIGTHPVPIVLSALLALLLLAAAADTTDAGEAVYKAYCVSCHGVAGRLYSGWPEAESSRPAVQKSAAKIQRRIVQQHRSRV
jgi:mono/diheme cytochrome c family protein